MIDLALFAGRILLLALLYLFLFTAVRAGLGLVRVQTPKKPGVLLLTVRQGPPELAGVTLPLTAPVVIGRSPGADIVIGDDFVSGRHARVAPLGAEVILEDLGSTNGTMLNGHRVTTPQTLRPGDSIEIGAVKLEVDRS